MSTLDAFLATLEAVRPQLAVITAPPAEPADLDRLADACARRPGMPTVLVNEPAAAEARIRALRNGFDDALPSSIAPAELAARLTLLAERAARSRRTAGGHLVSEDVELDLRARRLLRAGAPVHLRPKEFGLLALLAGHPGRVYTRRELLDRVWGSDRAVTIRTVDVHVRWLRAKLERDPGNPAHLVTVRGIGYRFDPPGSAPSLTQS
jgi:DNA-binding response OmpR family regulator